MLKLFIIITKMKFVPKILITLLLFSVIFSNPNLKQNPPANRPATGKFIYKYYS